MGPGAGISGDKRTEVQHLGRTQPFWFHSFGHNHLGLGVGVGHRTGDKGTGAWRAQPSSEDCGFEPHTGWTCSFKKGDLLARRSRKVAVQREKPVGVLGNLSSVLPLQHFCFACLFCIVRLKGRCPPPVTCKQTTDARSEIKLYLSTVRGLHAPLQRFFPCSSVATHGANHSGSTPRLHKSQCGHRRTMSSKGGSPVLVCEGRADQREFERTRIAPRL